MGWCRSWHLCWLLLLLFAGDARAFSSDECDWTGSGLLQDGQPVKGVQPVYLRCAQGTVTWQYPQGALRVVLRHGTSGKDFRGCLRPGRHFGGARIFLEGHRKLHPLFSPQDGQSRDLLRCFVSRNGQVALYVEADTLNNSLKRRVASFAYDLQSVSARGLANDMEECRPCTEQELLQLFCTSHFVVQGTVMSLDHRQDVQLTEMTVGASRVIRDADPPVFRSNKLLDNHSGTVHRPLKCGTQSGSGHFLFMGRKVLGLSMVQCAPRLSEWKRVRRKALEESSNQCQLD